MANEKHVQSGKMPLRFAHPYFVCLTPENSGTWYEEDENLTIWQLKVNSPGAKSINLIFDQFKLEEGARLFIYNTDQSQVLGAFTSENNKPSGLFATAPVVGDEIIIELQTKVRNKDDHQIMISAINHDYLGIVGLIKAGMFGDSGDCNIDVSCEGEQYDIIKRSVCRIIVDGTELCSGTMVNNAANDGKALFLTAAHCFHRAINRENVVFCFNYEIPQCQTHIEGSSIQTTSGANLLAIADTLDFALLEMQEYPPATYMPYWAGWDRSVAFDGPVYSIHHPSGDVKKIAVENEAPVAVSSNLTTMDGKPFIKDAHWWIQRWDKGVTEGGSSGGGLFSSGDKLIGTLSGGSAVCGNPVDDYFARLNKYWDHVSTSDGQVAHWLDPNNTNILSIGGRDYYEDVEMTRISHVSEGAKVTLKNATDFTGYVSGHNSQGHDAYAEFFYELQMANIHGVYLIPAKSKLTSSQVINLKIWEGQNGVPGKELAVKSNIQLRSLEQNKEKLITFFPPVATEGSFFVGVELMYDGMPVDTFALYNIESTNAHRLNRAYVRDQGEWKLYKDLYPVEGNGMFWIDVLASDITYTVGVDDYEQEMTDVVIMPNPVKNSIFSYYSEKNFETIKLINLNGQTVYVQQADSGKKVYLPTLPAGLYIVAFEKGDFVIRKKIFVMP